MSENISKDVPIRDVMTPEPVCIHVHQSVAEASKLMSERRIRHLPVLQGNHLVGVLSERDTTCVGGIKHLDPNRVTVAEAMQPPYVCGPQTLLSEVATAMLEQRLEAAVVQERGKTIGIFTQLDAVRLLVTLLTDSAQRG